MKFFSHRRTILLFAAIFFSLTLSADTLRFRSGQVLGAELTTRKIAVANINPDAPPVIPAQPVYAVVTVKPDDFRAISVFDYTLELVGQEFACVAINTGKRFEFTDAPIYNTGIIQLLFIADGRSAGKLPVEYLVLKSKLPPHSKVYDCKIPFTNLGNQAAKAPSAFDLKGTFQPQKEVK